MKKRLIFLFGMWVLVGCAGLVIHAEPESTMMAVVPHSGPPEHPTYLTGDEQAWKDFPKAPALGSPVDEADLVITLTAQAKRTQAQEDEAMHDKDYSINLVTEVIAPDFATKYPKTYEVLKQADKDAYYVNSKLKNENARLRPLDQHPILVIPLFSAKSFSYPSGHSSGSELQALILGVLFPAQAEDLLKRARQIADSRVVAGVHYASDTEAGQHLGELLFKELEANPKFTQALADAAKADGIPLK